MIELTVSGESAMLSLGAKLAACCRDGGLITLQGDLGTGKTTLVRGILRGMGWQDKVKSPTFTLVEPYEWGEHRVYHFDLYRLAHGEELEYMGMRDYLQRGNLCLVEWPERAADYLPKGDAQIEIQHAEKARQVIFHKIGPLKACIPNPSPD